MDKNKNTEQNKQENRVLRDNFKNINDFKSGKSSKDNDAEVDQSQRSRDMRDNLKKHKQ